MPAANRKWRKSPLHRLLLNFTAPDFMMLPRRVTHFPIRHPLLSFQISGLFGTLFSFREDHSTLQPPRGVALKIRNASELCSNPYLLSAPTEVTQQPTSTPLTPEAEKWAIRFLERLIWLSRRQFLCTRFYASWRVPLFATAREAIVFFRQHAEGDQEELCLARALFAAKTSRMFADHGAVVIGVFLPSRAMHAWVIEGDEMADPYDGIWINYQPVAMLS